MKKLLLFILLFLINSPFGNSCGYYPYGEDVRFSFLKPSKIYPHSNNYFFYNSRQYSDQNISNNEYQSGQYAENIKLWADLLKLKSNNRDIYKAIYEANSQSLDDLYSPNVAIQALNNSENKEALDYLIFAKSISYLNGDLDDPWERGGRSYAEKRNKMIAKSIMNSHKAKSKEIKRRYAHLAIRLAYYNNDAEKLNQLFRSYFDRTQLNDALDFWALHFKTQLDKPSPQRNVNAALVFANSPEKRLQASKKIESEFSLEECLLLAKTDLERSSLYFAYAARSAEPMLNELTQFGTVSSNEENLMFLTLREINKLEDWILTPYYSAFEPTMRNTWSDTITGKILMKRIIKDRKHAEKLSEWIASTRKNNPGFTNEWWGTMQLHADFLASNLDRLSEKLVAEKNKQKDNRAIVEFLDKLNVLVKIVNSPEQSLVELGVADLVYDYDADNQFLFAVGRELEFKGNKTEAATILSKVNAGTDYSESVVWKTQSRHRSLGMDFYYDYYFYMDAAYEADEVAALIDYITTHENKTNFDIWKNSTVKQDLNRLYDLLGTKYLRKDNLAASLQAFKKVDPDFWNQEKFTLYLSDDPFDNNFIKNDINASNKSYTKPQIVEKLIKYKAKVAATTGDEKAVNAFRVANCYRNMTYHGNAWLMRRFWWSGGHQNAGLEDDEEYIQANLAKKYYLLAKESAETEKFAALSMRLAGTCEKYKLYSEIENQWDYDDVDLYVYEQNDVYARLKTEFPNQYEPLMSNCATLYTYFDAVKE